MQANAAEVKELLRAVGDNQGVHSPDRADGRVERKPGVVLEDRQLWSKFKQLTNEMIVTKSGR